MRLSGSAQVRLTSTEHDEGVNIRIAGAGLLIAATALAGCAGQSGAAAKGTPTPQQREQAFLKFAQCMRDHGIDMPDPTTDSNGNLQMSRPTNVKFDNQADRKKLRTASEACRSNLKGVVQQFTPQQRAQLQDNLVKLAQCMRSNGVDMPDPNFSDNPGTGGGRREFFGGINRNDPKVKQALQTCRTKVFGGQAGDGPFGGRGGGIFFGGGGGRGGD
jgi:hypothetical protein